MYRPGGDELGVLEAVDPALSDQEVDADLARALPHRQLIDDQRVQLRHAVLGVTCGREWGQ